MCSTSTDIREFKAKHFALQNRLSEIGNYLATPLNAIEYGKVYANLISVKASARHLAKYHCKCGECRDLFEQLF